ncbi:phage tail tape measure protein [Nocardioides alkalitolerans]|uniref:phage tail tape measure protein n=1 Tax=Nocardioides alkalitolerans TaxID=281714 RepID=UPI00041FD1C3|nr:phage tail tape measure protein [Nocardioides alkalitolerans]
MAGEVASAFVSLMPSAQGFGPALDAETSGPVGRVAKNLGKIIAAGILAGTAVVGAGIFEAIEQERDADRMAGALGLSPEESKRLGGIAGGLYADAYGESFGEVTGAVEAVVSSIAGMSSASSADIESVTAAALDFASAFETDVARSSQVAGQLISTGLAKDATEAFDLITTASQRVPKALREDILDAGDEYGQFFATLGFSGEQAFAILVDGAEKGMFGIDKAGDAIKEFTIRATDMSTATQDALGTLGLDAGQIANDILAGGDTASAAFEKILTGFNSLPDGATKANAAIALFGTPLEDLSVAGIPEFINSLSGGSESMAGFAGSAEALGETLGDNAATNIEKFKRHITQGVVDAVGGYALPVINDLANSLTDNLAPAVSVAADIFRDDILPVAQLVGEKVLELGGAAVDAGEKAVPMFVAIAEALEPLAAFVAAAVIGALSVSFDVLMSAMEPAGAAFDWIAGLAERYPTLFGAVAAGLVGITVALYAWKTGVMIVTGVTKAWAIAQGALNAVMLMNPIGLVVLAIVALVAAFVYAWTNSETFREFVTNAFAKVLSIAMSVVNFFRNDIPAGWSWLRAKTVEIIGSMAAWIGQKIEAVKGVFRSIGVIVGMVIGYFVSIKDGTIARAVEMVAWFGGIGGRLAAGARGMWDWIGDTFRSALNAVIRMWNNFELTIDIPDAIPGLPDEWTIRTPNIPLLAEGGFVTKPTLVIAGEAGTEAIVPLPRLGEFADRATGGRRDGDDGVSSADLDRMVDRLAEAINSRPNVLKVNDRDAAYLQMQQDRAMEDLAS